MTAAALIKTHPSSIHLGHQGPAPRGAPGAQPPALALRPHSGGPDSRPSHGDVGVAS